MPIETDKQTSKKNPKLTEAQIEDYKKLEILTNEAQRQEELRYVNKLQNIYTEAKLFKDQFSSEWDNYVNFVRGKQWPGKRPRYKIDAVLNIMLENLERKDALLTDSKPIPKVTARSDQYQDTADILNIMLQQIFESSSFNQVMVDLVHNSQMFGSGGTGTVYNVDTFTDLGNNEVISYDTGSYYFDPLVRRPYLLQEGEYFVVEDVWSLAKAQDMYPKVADRINANEGLSRYSLLVAKTGPGFFNRMQSVVAKRREQPYAVSEIPRVYVREFWLRDRQKENGKYVFNKASRKSVLIENVLVDDGANPYNDGMYPQDIMNWHRDYYSGFGWGDAELLTSPQMLENKVMATIVENIIMTSNGIWVGDEDALSKEQWNKLTNEPGTFVKKRPDRELRRESGVPLPTYVLDTLGIVKQSAEEVTGMVDVARGVASGQISSGVGVESLQLMAQSLIRLRARELEALQSRIGRKLISRIFQFTPPGEIMQVVKDVRGDGQDLEAIQSELLKPIKDRKKGAWTNFAFAIEPGSSLGLAKQQKNIQSLQLRKMEVIDDQALLDDLEYPHRTQVLKRKREETSAKEALQMKEKTNGQGTQFPQQPGASPIGRTQ